MFLLRRITIERSMVKNYIPIYFAIIFFLFHRKDLNPKYPLPCVCVRDREKDDGGFRCRPAHTVALAHDRICGTPCSFTSIQKSYQLHR